MLRASQIMKKCIHRQGDILIVAVTSIPFGAKPMKKRKGRLILAEGEIVGHCHEIIDPTAKAFLLGDAMYLDLETETEVFHPDHNDPKNNKIPQILKPGPHRVYRQMEYRRKELERVRD